MIRDGAYPVSSADDILNVLGPMTRRVAVPCQPDPIRHPNELSLNDIEQTVMRQIGTGPTPIDSITELAPHQVRTALGVLEEKRIIRYVKEDSVARM